MQIDITPQSTSVVLELLPDTAYEVVALDVSTPIVFTGSADPVTSSADITMNASDEAISLTRAADDWAQTSESEDILVEQSESGLLIDVVDAPSLSGADGRVDSSLAAFDPGGQVPVALSTELAQANSLSVGSRVDLESFGAVVGAEVVQIVDAVPGFSSPRLIVADSAALSVALYAEGATPPAADEVWVSSAQPTQTAAEMPRCRALCLLSQARRSK
ncbi:hypothetical protein [Ornithinimicrobium sp. INDO-MA30-4]|uniref:hypothetical protein n=1 Tax=Ornithinimicrobium sp. INDO-MA30-4 TaxID=2908651 RepID=UPI001F217115|nr:hypothetical protein [Ornithinimicrobium sp. INDO-MA30-4]UJH69689.1 hypothetical protein L0A91_10190 [Ornithinimicrobium sp. INDO-MA30-4]